MSGDDQDVVYAAYLATLVWGPPDLFDSPKSVAADPERLRVLTATAIGVSHKGTSEPPWSKDRVLALVAALHGSLTS